MTAVLRSIGGWALAGLASALMDPLHRWLASTIIGAAIGALIGLAHATPTKPPPPREEPPPPPFKPFER